MSVNIQIVGYIVGPIWWPSGAECWKDLGYNATSQQARTVGKMTLRDHVLRALQDGDFQSATLATCQLVVTSTRFAEGRRVTKTRFYDLSRFPSIADCLHPDPDWCPQFDDEEAA